MEVGGRTQYKTRVQGMPKEVEKQLERMISDFLWNGHTPGVNVETMRLPHTEGGFKILDIEARNEAIDLMKLKAYLDFEKRPKWALIVDHLLTLNIPKSHRVTSTGVAENMFTQTWAAAKRETESCAPAGIRKMLATAAKYGVTLDPRNPSEETKLDMPLWFHAGQNKEKRPWNNGARADCLRDNHEVHTV
ncbi:hypothetical protein DFP72DRAFT_804738, partial [Ephemerocybe angulata]